MRRLASLSVVLLTGAICGACLATVLAAPATSYCALTERNRAIVTSFADLFYRHRNPRSAFMAYVAPDYIQHNPGIADGRDAAIAAMVPMMATPGATFDIKRIMVDGDMAVIHLFGRGDPTTLGGAVTDIYRLHNGKIVEHWDVLQAIPAHSNNPHPMF